MMDTRRLWIARIALSGAAVILLAGCSLTRAPLVKATYLLEPAPPPAVARTQSGMLRIGTVNVGAPFRGRSFVVRATDLRYEADYYNEFFVPPGINISDATGRALAAAKVFASVAPPGGGLDAQWTLEAFVDGVYADARDAAKPMAVISISYYLSRTSVDPSTPIWTRSYERRVRFTAGDTASYIAALNTGLGEILTQLATDLSGATLPAK